jgi:hypothetical protein
MSHPLPVAHLSGAVLDALKPATLHAPGVLLKSSNNRDLRTAYHQILDDLDDDKDLTFAHIQTVCARQFRRTKERHPDPSHRADTPRATPRTSSVKTEKYNKYKHQGGNQPGKVLRRAGLAGAEWNEPASVTALLMMLFIGT